MRKFMMGATALALMLSGASMAFAHHTGHESRTAAQCELLPGTATTGERGNCIRCVADGHHHFHPDDVRGNRCHPDNGRPQ